MFCHIIRGFKKVLKPFQCESTPEQNAIESEMDRALHRICKHGYKPLTVIDVGVGNGTNELYSAFPSANLFLVEPLQEFEGTIQSILSKRQGGYVIAAAGASKCIQSINVHENHLEGSSLFKESTASIDDGEPREISVVTLDDLANDNALKGPFLIKVDAQGYELEVMQGAQTILETTEVIILEVLLYKFLTQNPILHDIVAYMHAQGFVCYDIFGMSYRPKDQALAHLDIVFVKEHGMFRQHNDWQ